MSVKCDYCDSKFIEDSRGNCNACGAPEPVAYHGLSGRSMNVEPMYSTNSTVVNSYNFDSTHVMSWSQFKKEHSPWRK